MADITNVKLANIARNQAVRTLISENKEHYDELLAKERLDRGLPVSTDLAKRRNQAEKAVKKLQDLGVTVSLDDILAAIQ